ncbi:uncharacterized protein [Acropora muricata]|uniref:uncharacterized protein n=1 Tax=Acropora muricata TaxID=159855 RepID=UPI0034E40C55
MAHRILKCTVCGGDHSIFHCENKCGVCHGDNRKCSCSEQPPSKKKKSRKQKQSSGDQQSVADLRKLYDNLQKEHERVGSAFQNLKDQNEELARDLAEREADLEELTNLVSTKDEVIKNAERRLLHAKKLIADLKAEVQSLRSRNDQQEPEQQTPQQQSEAEIGRVNSHSLSSIHSRYAKVLQVIDDNRCSMANAFRLAGCPRSTVWDFVAIAELKIVDHREHDRVIRDHAGSVKELEAICRRRLRSYLPVMANLRREGKLLPLKFDERFYPE